MSTRTVAVDSQVYRRLAAAKKEGESFSKTIARLLDVVGAAYTGRDILNGLSEVPRLSEEDSEVMLAAIAENRRSESWTEHDLR